LIECHRTRRPQIVIPMFRGFRGNPVLLDRSVFAEVRELSGDVGCRAIFGKHTENIYKLPMDDPGILLDIDSREDFAALAKIGRLTGDAALKPGASPLEGGESANASVPELVVVGRDAVARALAKLGRLMKFTVTLVDPWMPRSDAPTADRMLRALDFSLLPVVDERYVVVASRGQFDEEALEQALRVNASY